MAGARAVTPVVPYVLAGRIPNDGLLASLGLCSPGMAHPPLLTWKEAVGGDHQSGDLEDLNGLQTKGELAVRKAVITSHMGGGC